MRKVIDGLIGRWSHYFGAFFFVNVFGFGVLFIPCIHAECVHGTTSWWVFWAVLIGYQTVALIAGEANYQGDKNTKYYRGF